MFDIHWAQYCKLYSDMPLSDLVFSVSESGYHDRNIKLMREWNK